MHRRCQGPSLCQNSLHQPSLCKPSLCQLCLWHSRRTWPLRLQHRKTTPRPLHPQRNPRQRPSPQARWLCQSQRRLTRPQDRNLASHCQTWSLLRPPLIWPRHPVQVPPRLWHCRQRMQPRFPPRQQQRPLPGWRRQSRLRHHKTVQRPARLPLRMTALRLRWPRPRKLPCRKRTLHLRPRKTPHHRRRRKRMMCC